MANFSWRDGLKGLNLQRDVDRVKELTVRYAKEETIDPLKQLGRFSAFGCLGSLLIGLGSLFLLVGTLRLLQDETGAFHGNLSWLPYVIVAALALLIFALTIWRTFSGPARRRRSKSKS
jgi:hypothetical protein